MNAMDFARNAIGPWPRRLAEATPSTASGLEGDGLAEERATASGGPSRP